MVRVKLRAIQTVLEDESHYAQILNDKFIKSKGYKELINSLETALKLSGLSTRILEPFKQMNGCYLNLPYTVTENTISALTEDRRLTIPLFIALNKLKLYDLTDLGPLKNAVDEPLIQIFRKFRQLNISPDKFEIDDFKQKLESYKLSPLLFKMVHISLLSARCEYLLPNLLKEIEHKTFKKVKDLLDLPIIYLKYVSDTSIMKIVRGVLNRLEETERLASDEVKELDMFSTRVKEQLKNLYSETIKELRESIMDEIGLTSSQEILLRISALFTRLQRMLLGHLFHINDYLERKKRNEILMGDIVKLRTVTPAEFRKMFPLRSININFPEIYDEMVFFLSQGELNRDEWKFFGEAFLKNLEVHFKKAKENQSLRGELAVLSVYEKRGVFGGYINFELLYRKYLDFFHKEINPLILVSKIYDLVEIWPPRESQKRKHKISDLVNFGAMILPKSGILLPSNGDKKPEVDNREVISKFLRNYYRTVSVLCYDIRGSSYMGARLQNAEKERKIKYKFSLEMSNIVRQFGGFLLKDTGDGGIAWFGENSKALYERSYTEATTGKGFKLRYSIFSGGEFELLPSEDSAKRAILCALEMVKKAEEFIKANFVHYREWFGELKEREVKVEGITYALLPPAFRSLFRIGVGIASGMAGRDLVFGLNSFGDPDLVGPLLSDANFFSMGKEPTRSVIITDFKSIINLVANIEHFDIIPIKGEQDFIALTDMLTRMRNDDRGYIFNDLLFSIKKLGVYHLTSE
ncbi:MAG: hypothetical protein ABIL05_01780, partial [candidate division WOR-3 bacterium]